MESIGSLLIRVHEEKRKALQLIKATIDDEDLIRLDQLDLEYDNDSDAVVLTIDETCHPIGASIEKMVSAHKSALKKLGVDLVVVLNLPEHYWLYDE